jgi:hypothetical protein
MFTDNSRRTIAMLALSILAGTAISACGRSITGPDSRRAIRSADASQHDDDPSECRSGYQVVDGRVVCN